MPNSRENRAGAVPIQIQQADKVADVPWGGEEAASKAGFPFSGVVLLLVLLTLVLFFGSPYYKLLSLRKGLENGDVAMIARSVDFTGIKSQLINETAGVGGVDALGKMEEVQTFVDQNVNAQGIIDIFQMEPSDRPAIPVIGRSFGQFPISGTVKVRYKNLDTVEAEMDDGVVLFLERLGGFDWRVFRVDLPPE